MRDYTWGAVDGYDTLNGEHCSELGSKVLATKWVGVLKRCKIQEFWHPRKGTKNYICSFPANQLASMLKTLVMWYTCNSSAVQDEKKNPLLFKEKCWRCRMFEKHTILVLFVNTGAQPVIGRSYPSPTPECPLWHCCPNAELASPSKVVYIGTSWGLVFKLVREY